MSKWKSNRVAIIQISITNGMTIFGLGDDNKVYNWNHGTGGWERYWQEQDKPE